MSGGEKDVDIKPNLDEIILIPTEHDNDITAENLNSYPYETSQCALKNNPDYQSLLGCLAILWSQRLQASNDLNTLLEKKKQALNDPITFVSKLQKIDGKDDGLKFPLPIKITEVPDINWKKYTNDSNKFLRNGGENGDVCVRNKSKINSSSSEAEVKPFSDVEIKTIPSKPSKLFSLTHNQPWSIEEQKTLDALLVKYPPERFEARRWFKIAQELKTRTPQQVASRVQKYFLKLASQGLPIPGRQPTSASCLKKAFHRNNKYRNLDRKSTFLTSYEPPVTIPDEFSTNSDFL